MDYDTASGTKNSQGSQTHLLILMKLRLCMSASAQILNINNWEHKKTVSPLEVALLFQSNYTFCAFYFSWPLLKCHSYSVINRPAAGAIQHRAIIQPVFTSQQRNFVEVSSIFELVLLILCAPITVTLYSILMKSVNCKWDLTSDNIMYYM